MNTEIDPPRTIGRANAETMTLHKMLASASVGQVLTHKEMSDHCKVNTQGQNGILASARRMALRDGAVFGTIIGIGIKRLANDEITDEGETQIHRIRKAARKGLATLQCADVGALPPDLKVRHVTTATVLGFMKQSGERKVLALTEQTVRASGDSLKIGDIASLFGK